MSLIERLRDTASKGISAWGDLQLEAADEIERLTVLAYHQGLEIKWLTAERDTLKESATEWNHRYIDACQQHNDRQTNLGHQIVALEAERDALKSALQLIKANTSRADWPDDINAAIQGAGK